MQSLLRTYKIFHANLSILMRWRARRKRRWLAISFKMLEFLTLGVQPDDIIHKLSVILLYFALGVRHFVYVYAI